jgi:hypothetical protein
MRSLNRALFFSLILSTISFPASVLGQEPEKVTIRGTVVDGLTNRPLDGAIAMLEDLEIRVVTGPDGTFVMTEVPLGPHQLTVQRDGYETRSGRLTVQQAGDMVLPIMPIGDQLSSQMSRIRGIVRDLERDEPIGGVEVSLQPLAQTRLTDADGRFSFDNVPPGDFIISAQLMGYAVREEPLTVAEAKIVTLELGLAADPIELEPIEVSVEAREFGLEISGFYQRRESTSGMFMTRERIEQRAPLFTTDLFRGLAGVKVLGGLGMGTQNAVVLAGSRAMSFTTTPEECHPAVWIDGQMIHQGASSPINDGPAFLDEYIQPDQIAGIEVYSSSASVPVQYNLYAGCGVIVIWSRTGR